MIDYVITFFAVFVTDIIYTFYLKSVQHNSPLKASFWATVVTATASIAVINYTENHLMLIPALIGAFAGTWFGMKFKKKELE
jgi:hypothetical protein